MNIQAELDDARLDFAGAKECNCPDYVERCAHYGSLRVWLIGIESARKETVKRGLAPGAPCSRCGAKPTKDWAFGVYGPGVMTEADCLCRVPLAFSWLRQWKYLTAKAAAAAFTARESMMLADGGSSAVPGGC